MMKKIAIVGILFLLTLVFTFSVSSEESKKLDGNDRFKVIHVNGRILFKKSGTDMKRGDYYVAGTLLDFASNKARAAIIHKLKGRFVLTGSSKGKVKVLPAANNISSRGGALLNILDLKKFFEGRRLFLGHSKVQVGKDAFPMNNEKFFYLTFDHNGEEVAKRLSFDGDIVFFDKEEIFKIDGKAINYEEKEMTLYYRDNGKGKKINTFVPVFPNLVDLKEEVSVILEELDSETVGKKKDEVAAHINEFHGQVQLIELNDWLANEFDLK
jgi:hypothetical protein